MDKPITREEIAERIREKKLCAESYKHFAPVEWDREKHLRRVAFFVVNPDPTPIGIDVGFGFDDERWIVHDGNHRLAAAFYRRDKTISAGISGSLDVIKELLTRAAK